MPARLHLERIVRTGVNPVRWMALTHGIYGAGSNWRSIARKIHERRPDFGVVLVDLRGHGRSDAGEPPHDLAACAADLRAVFDEVPGIEVLAGHSFGGKVVLATRAIAPPQLRQSWMLDASPSPRPHAETDPANTVVAVLALMERLPRTWPRREDFVAAVTGAGHAAGLAQWLAMNLVPDGAGTLTLRLDLGAMRSMLADYYARDLWSVALDPSLPGDVEIVIAARSPALTPEDRARLAAAPPHVHTHTIDAGHWLHIDAPAAVVELFVASLPT